MIFYPTAPALDPAGDLRKAARSVGERDYRRIIFENPQMGEVFRRLSLYTAGKITPGLSAPLLHEVLQASVDSYNANGSLFHLIQAISHGIQPIIRVSVVAVGSNYERTWSQLDCSLIDFISSLKKGVGLRIYREGGGQGVAPTVYKESQLLIASRLFGTPDLERVGLIHKEDYA